ncbi:MAG: GerMN domain-containing protein [Roseburia sp.]|nr:GerMN domain-containing protein [Roseburia sp.]
MRKRFSMVFLIVGCLMGLCACSRKEPEGENICQVYYLSNSETRIEAHTYEMQAEDMEGQLSELVDCLSTNPEKLEYKAPLSTGFEVLTVELQEGRALLDVNRGYLDLEPTTEVLVRAALVRTLTQIEDINYVGITVEGNQLFDSVGELVGWMNKEQFINNDGNEINTYELIKVKLYFANETGDKLIEAYREKHYSTNMPLERFVLEELIAGPSGQVEGMYPSVNPQTKINNVMTKDGICYVNLDASFLTVVNNVSTEVAIYSIVNSLAELNHITKVQVLINGEVPETFSSSVYERNLDYVIKLNP